MDKHNNHLTISIGDEVGWPWGNGIATGIVQSIHPHKSEIITKDVKIVRNGTASNPAVIITHKKGNKVIKLLSEITKIQTQ